MFIYYSLGRSWGGISLHYVLSYSLLTFIALIFGVPLGMFLAYLFNNSLIVKAMTANNMELTEISRYTVFNSKSVTAAGITAAVCFAVVIISVTVTVVSVIRKQIRNVL
jgi:ABC-type antimicrobial peptide transport system permease subunit